MTTSLELELRRHADALRRVAASLVGDGRADDLVQDAAVAWLGARGDVPERPAPWLFAVVRRLASKRRRDEERRRRRESAVAREDAVVGEDPASAAEREEVIAGLTRALLALDEPYRGTLLGRYFEGLTPTQLAARTGEPVATVKKRLQRGLAALRDRLQKSTGADWRAALAGAFNLRPTAPALAAGAGMAWLQGVVIGKTIALVSAALAVSVIAWLAWPAASSLAPVVVAGGDTEPIAAESTADTSPPSARHRLVDAPSASPQDAAAVPARELRGRCVDEDGRPLPDAKVLAWSVPGTTPAFIAAAADGAFTWTIPAGAVQVGFNADREGLLRAHGHFSIIPASGVLEVGDVVLVRPVFVSGRVVDDLGAPQAGLAVALHCSDRGDEHVQTTDSAKATARADGTFGPLGMPPGNIVVRAGGGFATGEPVHLRLERGMAPQHVEVVVCSVDPAAFAGTVVDGDGAPLGRVSVSCEGLQTDLFEGQPLHFVHTEADGRFVMPLPRRLGPGPFRLILRQSRLREVRSEPVLRGSTNLRFVMRRKPGLLVRVVTEDGVPVTRYVLEFAARSGQERSRTSAHEEHANGVFENPKLEPGEYSLRVEPTDAGLLGSGAIDIVVGEARAEVTVRLRAAATRTVRVEDEAERPVRDAELALLDGRESRSLREVRGLAEALGGSGPREVDTARSDAMGTARLRGDPSRTYRLRVRAGGARRTELEDVRIGGDEPLVVVLPRGAMLRGRLRPAGIVRELSALMADDRSGQGFGLGLWRRGPNGGRESLRSGVQQSHGELPFALADDDTFAIAGVPAGIWRVKLIAGNTHWTFCEHEFADGAEVELELDASQLEPATIVFQLTRSGREADAQLVLFVSTGVQDGFGGQLSWSGKRRADARGRLEVPTFAGEVRWSVEGAAGEGLVQMPPFAVAAGARVVHMQDLRLARSLLRLRTSDGVPAGGAIVSVGFPGSSMSVFRHLRADGDGLVDVAGLLAHPHLLRVLPRALDTGEVMPPGSHLLSRRPEGDWLDLGTVALREDEAPIEVRLPQAYER